MKALFHYYYISTVKQLRKAININGYDGFHDEHDARKFSFTPHVGLTVHCLNAVG